jgi:hypothetical protein
MLWIEMVIITQVDGRAQRCIGKQKTDDEGGESGTFLQSKPPLFVKLKEF